MKYKIEWLSTALEDLKETVSYISNELKNPTAAEDLAKEVVAQIESLSEFPYSAPHYEPIKPLKHEYRKLLVKNYFVFYWVDDKKKTVEIARIIYARRDLERIFE